jgi:hypothetical protein
MVEMRKRAIRLKHQDTLISMINKRNLMKMSAKDCYYLTISAFYSLLRL